MAGPLDGPDVAVTGKSKPLPQPGTGVVGFGCTFVVALAAGAPALLGSSWSAWLILVVVAAVLGLLAARFGESFFERMIGWLPWWS
jgi:hypothetical protein